MQSTGSEVRPLFQSLLDLTHLLCEPGQRESLDVLVWGKRIPISCFCPKMEVRKWMVITMPFAHSKCLTTVIIFINKNLSVAL